MSFQGGNIMQQYITSKNISRLHIILAVVWVAFCIKYNRQLKALPKMQQYAISMGGYSFFMALQYAKQYMQLVEEDRQEELNSLRIQNEFDQSIAKIYNIK
jgi:hypothetical protein